jgi:hypothetical protein
MYPRLWQQPVARVGPSGTTKALDVNGEDSVMEWLIAHSATHSIVANGVIVPQLLKDVAAER